MVFSFFHVLETDLLVEILRYETPEVVYKYTHHVNRQWQKAAILALASPNTSNNHLFQKQHLLAQEKLFKERIPLYLKNDRTFIHALSTQVLLSMRSCQSTPKHKQQGSFFLSYLNPLSDGHLSDDTLKYVGVAWLIDSQEEYRINASNDEYSNAAVLAFALSQTQVDRVVLNLMLELENHHMLELENNHNKSFLFYPLLLALLPRATYIQIQAFISKIIQRWHYQELKILTCLAAQLDVEQQNAVISKILAQPGFEPSVRYLDREYASLLMALAPKATPDEASRVFNKVIPLSNLCPEDKKKVLTAFAPRLSEAQMTAFIEGGSSRQDVLTVLAPHFSSEQAYVVFSYVRSKRTYHNDYDNRKRDFLIQVADKLNNEHAQSLITMIVSELHTNLVDNIDDIIILSKNLTRDHETTLFEAMMLIVKNLSFEDVFSDRYTFAFKMLGVLGSRLEPAQFEAAFAVLNAGLDDHNINNTHDTLLPMVIDTLLSTVMAWRPRLASDHMALLIPKMIGILMLENKCLDSSLYRRQRKALDALATVVEYLDETQVNIMHEKLVHLSQKSDMLFENGFIFNTLVALAFRLSEHQIKDVLDYVLSVNRSSNHRNPRVALNALIILMERCAQLPEQTLFEALSVLSDLTIEQEHDSTLHLTALNAAKTLALSLSQTQFDRYFDRWWVERINDAQTVDKYRFSLLPVFASRLNELQVSTVFTHLLSRLNQTAPDLEEHYEAYVEFVDGRRFELDALASLLPYLDETQGQSLFISICSLLSSNCSPHRCRALMMTNALKMTHQLDFTDLYHECKQGLQMQKYPHAEILLESLVMLDVMENIRASLSPQSESSHLVL